MSKKPVIVNGEMEAIKENVIALAKNHRERGCEQENCRISLYLLYRLATLAGLEFSAKERAEFI